MKIESLNNEQLGIVENNSGLRIYLNNLSKGRPATPRSWLYEGKSDTEVLNLWLKQLETIQASEHGKLVFQFDTSQLKKWGPQGKVAPIKELMDIVTAGFEREASPSPKIFRTKEWQNAKAKAVHYLTGATGWHTLQPRAYEHVVDNMSDRDTLESNSGWPDFRRRKLPEVLQNAYQAIRDGSWLEFPAIALFRNYNAKTRLVWMYPLAVNIVEGSYVQPLKEAIMASDLNFFAPWRGYDHVLARISQHYGKGEFLSASDFSHTDEHFKKWQMFEVYDVIKHCYQEKYWPGLKQSLLRVCTIPLVIGPNEMIVGEHGVSSGSNWTNDVETYMDFIGEIFNTILGFVKEPDTAIGDDISHRTDIYDPKLADKLADVYRQEGFDVNAEKVTNERDWVKYLQRLTIRGFNSNRTYTVKGVEYPYLRGIYSTIRALNSSLNPEKYHSPKLWSKDMFAVRQFMILENCIDHPYFEKFVKFVLDGHSYLREFAKQTDRQINDAQAQSRILPGLNPTYNQEKRDKPLSSFESIKLARKI